MDHDVVRHPQRSHLFDDSGIEIQEMLNFDFIDA